MKKLNAFLNNVNQHIDQNGFDDVLDFIPYMEDLQFDNWSSFVKIENGRPVNTTIYQSDQFRMIIIFWDGHQESSIHGHADGGGLIKVLSGSLKETRFDPVDKNVLGTYHYEEDSITYIHDMIALHQVKNPNPHPAFSLHMYTKRA